ncbi:hypothetical protein L202_05457 [Cryptococcus amylolentus CBS 6039]|uniref:Uncharacterized protein n=2 Tax=Cryptococcus amylolentus TaxID=104669 RepID=A0A1E3HKL1_9TREE|nr:hypothetical protein L202_05457 [Cryptococcus amylolentus CBS 6039]ODN76869.1 hypothetical protein L202_05457 [Cryptococcus amylolentus CBS 6039]ODO04776.1 hypothetical protein I350_05386 [Cryptococcus amylolentus CBS 6273]
MGRDKPLNQHKSKKEKMAEKKQAKAIATREMQAKPGKTKIEGSEPKKAKAGEPEAQVDVSK